jgi:hypothetical protein
MQVLQRLQAKRAALEKELGKLPGAPSSAKDIFHLCRGFERVFCYTVEVRACIRACNLYTFACKLHAAEQKRCLDDEAA